MGRGIPVPPLLIRSVGRRANSTAFPLARRFSLEFQSVSPHHHHHPTPTLSSQPDPRTAVVTHFASRSCRDVSGPATTPTNNVFPRCAPTRAPSGPGAAHDRPPHTPPSSKSGNPGYVRGLPLNVGSLVQLSAGTASEKRAIQPREAGFELFAPGADGSCPSATGGTPVPFGADARVDCTVALTLSGLQSYCEQQTVRARRRRHLPVPHHLCLAPHPCRRSGSWPRTRPTWDCTAIRTLCSSTSGFRSRSPSPQRPPSRAGSA